MEIKVLGPGCPTCKTFENLVNQAVKELGINVKIEKVTDIVEIMKHTFSTPALVIDGKLRYAGKPLPTLEKLKELLQKEV